jgi:F-type H+-transporting ATPase subunit b
VAQNISSHTEVPAQVGGFPPFQKDTFASQLIWLAISFALLYVLVAKIGLPRVSAILEERQKHIAYDVAEANRSKAESQDIMNAYEGALSHARNRAGTLISKIHQKLNAEAKRNRKVLEMDLKLRLSDAESAIAAAKAAAAANVSGIAIELASAIVARLIETMPSRKVVTDAVDHVMKR